MIKFITGNPYNDDWNVIRDSINNSNQFNKKTITIAQDLENQLHQTVRELNHNVNEIKDVLCNITNIETSINFCHSDDDIQLSKQLSIS